MKNKYKVIRVPDGHPLRNDSPKAQFLYEHRLVMFDINGYGPYNCNWCNKSLTWSEMEVDHLDEIKSNNQPTNLVSSCRSCNSKRGQNKRRRVALDSDGIEFNGITKTIPNWASDLGISPEGLRDRIAKGWSLERALTTPRRKKNQNWYIKTVDSSHQ